MVQQVATVTYDPNYQTQDLNFENNKMTELSSPQSNCEVKVKEEGASVLNATANITKTGLGLGMLFMPLIFSKCGIYIPILALTFFGILCFYSWNLLGLVLKHVEKSEIYTKTELYQTYKQNLTMENTLAIVFNPGWRIFTQIINALNMYGGCLGYVIFITQSFEDYIPPFIVRVCVIAALYFPLSFLKDIKSYGKFSQIALTIYFVVLLTIIGRSLQIVHEKSYPDEPIILNGWSNLLQYLGIFILAYDVNGTVSIVHASMKDNKKFWIPLASYLIFACCLGIFIGIAGSLAYRSELGDVIFKNIGSLNGGGDVILILFCLTLIISFSLYGFVQTRMIDAVIFKKDEETIRKTVPVLYRFSIRVLFFASLAILAYVFPKASTLFSLLGSIFGVILTYILPCLLYEKIYFNSKISAIRITNYFVMVIGGAGGIAGFVFSLLDLIN